MYEDASCGCDGQEVVYESAGCGCGGEVVIDSGQSMMYADEGQSVPMDAPEPPTFAAEEPATDRQVNKPVEEEVGRGDEMMAPALTDDEATQPLPPPVEPPAARPEASVVDQPAGGDMFGAADNGELFDDDAAGAAMDNAATAEVADEGQDLFGNAGGEVPEEAAPVEEDMFGGNDDMFSQPAAEEAVEEAAPVEDDMFAEPATEQPAEEPAAAEEDMFGGDDDLFGAPAAEEAVEEPAPADDASGDDMFGGDNELFGAPAAEEATEDPAPADEAAGDDMFGGGDDLFGAPAVEEPAQEAAPADEAAADDASGDDLFGGEELFGTPAAEAPAEETAPAEEPADDSSEIDDLFGPASILEQPGGYDSLALRHWVDNTGRYTVDARLLSVVDGHVRLLKASGRTTTVSLSRLSDADLQFVDRQAAARSALDIARTAQR